ncbi:MAG: M20/M25/M40 family metallo-hydrolase [Acidobacteriia bacterium]|nr:M20/M25/M40 family metallo-hydrolase [Terriglobia bacterium]
MKILALILPAALTAFAAFAQTAPTAPQIAERLTANDLKADVSFLASDALQGRATPSPGLDIAAEFLAAQFRRSGLEPAGDDGYLQTAAFASVKPNREKLELTIEIGEKQLKVDPGLMTVWRPAAADLRDAAVARASTPAEAAAWKPEDTRGKVLLMEVSRFSRNPAEWDPAMVIMVESAAPRGIAGPALQDASVPAERFPLLMVWDPAVRAALAADKTAAIRVSAHVAAPMVEPVKLRNVVGVLRGSDPALKDTCLVLSAHYDHLGVRAGGEGDRIFNGANDDASGAAAVVEIARALASQPVKPRRSIVFALFFGEEGGGLGSRYYTQHPVFPLARTIADVNLEQLGRIDDTQGSRPGQFNLTGFDFTNLAPAIREAAQQAGVQVVKDEKNNERYFGASDNLMFSMAGVPSTTASVTYQFPDYHGVGDEWPKLDYDNMAKVDCALALAVFRLADSADAPQWNAENPRTAAYMKARQAK